MPILIIWGLNSLNLINPTQNPHNTEILLKSKLDFVFYLLETNQRLLVALRIKTNTLKRAYKAWSVFLLSS